MRIKADIRIGERAWSEILRAERTTADMARLIGVQRKTLYAWRDGETPNTRALARMAHMNFDIYYILTGYRRIEKG